MYERLHLRRLLLVLTFTGNTKTRNNNKSDVLNFLLNNHVLDFARTKIDWFNFIQYRIHALEREKSSPVCAKLSCVYCILLHNNSFSLC